MGHPIITNQILKTKDAIQWIAKINAVPFQAPKKRRQRTDQTDGPKDRKKGREKNVEEEEEVEVEEE